MIKLNLLSGEINLPLPGPVKTRGAPSRLRRLWIHPPSLPDQTLLLSVHPLELHEHYIHIIYYVLGTSYTSKLRWYRTPIKVNKRYPICSKQPASYSWMHCFHQHKRHKPYRSPVRGTWPIILKCIQIRNINVLNRRVYSNLFPPTQLFAHLKITEISHINPLQLPPEARVTRTSGKLFPPSRTRNFFAASHPLHLLE